MRMRVAWTVLAVLVATAAVSEEAVKGQPTAPVQPAAGAAPAAVQQAAAQPAATQASALADGEKLSYALGMDLAAQFKRQSVQLNPDVFARGMRDAQAGGSTLLTEQEAQAVITAFKVEMRKKYETERLAAAEKNKGAGEAFLAANKAKAGVVTLESGLQYQVLTAGTGKKPTLEDTVVCQYRGTLVDGKEFDSSYSRNEPATFPVKGVIKGWTEALQLMPVGSKWRIFIPPQLGYGPAGAGPIGPNATLVFELELLSIK